MIWIRAVVGIGFFAACCGLSSQTVIADVPTETTPDAVAKPAPEKKEATKTPVAVYLTVGSPLSDSVQAKVLNAARKVQQQADQEGPCRPGTALGHLDSCRPG